MSKSQRLNKKKILFFTVAAIILSPLVWIGATYIMIVLDTKGLECEELPNWDQAEKIFYEHNDTISQIEAISPGNIFVSLHEPCADKGEVVISYDSIDSRNKIKDLIGDSFYGIPYVMYNI